MGNLVISYEKSNKDVPVLVVARENSGYFMGSTGHIILKTFTGDEATELYRKLTSKEEN